MSRVHTSLGSLALSSALALAALPAPAQAEVLLIQRVQQARSIELPARGLSMQAVEARFGAPLERRPTAGGDAAAHPPINAWRYASFTVYFERDRVISSVLNRASPQELGPKPVR